MLRYLYLALAWLFANLLAVGSVGCGALNTGITAFPAEFADSARVVAADITNQAVWDRILARLDGQIIEPGLEFYTGVVYVYGAKMPGVSGQLSVEGDGEGTGQIDPDAKAAAIDLLLRVPAQQRRETLERLFPGQDVTPILNELVNYGG